jgi:ammonium transporter, Amt family
VTIAASIIIKGLSLVMPMRVDRKEEELGLDQGEHGEEADYTVEMSKDLDEYRSDLNLYSKEFRGQLGGLDVPKDPRLH